MTPIIPKRKLTNFDDHDNDPDKSLNFENDVAFRRNKKNVSESNFKCDERKEI